VEDVTAFILQEAAVREWAPTRRCSRSTVRLCWNARCIPLLRLRREAVIVGPGERYAAFGEVIEDVYVGCGPLAGIHAALGASIPM